MSASTDYDLNGLLLEGNGLVRLFDEAPVAFVILRGPDHIIERVNRLGCQIWGRTSAQVQDRPLFEALPEAAGQGLEELLAGVLATGQSASGQEHRVRLARGDGGAQVDCFFNFIYQALRDARGAFDRVLVVATDVTAQVEARQHAEALAIKLRESDERQRLVMEASGAGTWDLEVASGRLTVDSQLLALFDNQAFATLEASLQCVAPQHRQTVARAVEAAVRGENEGRLSVEFLVDRPAGEEPRWLEARGQTIRDGPDKAARLAGACIDVTLNKQAEELERHLAGIVGHDLRGPLQTILMSAQAILQMPEASDGALRSAARRITNAGKRAARMVDDLMDFTRARIGGGIRVVRRPGCLFDLAGTVLDEIKAAHPSRAVKLEQTGDSHAEFDGDRIAQVMTNLVRNALDYGPPDLPVSVSVVGKDAEVELSVHNHGAPIPARRLREIFSPFDRGPTETGRNERGLGLGLYIVEAIAHAHGGAVAVDSTEETGTTFTVRLPRAPLVP